jgi:hypothetical protein
MDTRLVDALAIRLDVAAAALDIMTTRICSDRGSGWFAGPLMKLRL